MKKTLKKQSAGKDFDPDLEQIVAELRKKVQELEKMLTDYMSTRLSSSQSRYITDQFQCRKCPKGSMTKYELQIHLRTDHKETVKCKACTKSFDKNSDLKLHMTTDHESEKLHKCDICEKTFVFEWRLKKHKIMHEKANGKHCHYYNNGKNCPFEEIGCKFQHLSSAKCKFGQTCMVKMCQYTHEVYSTCKEDTSFDNIASEDFTDTNDKQVQKDENKDESKDVHKGKEKIYVKSAAETEDIIECAHCDIQIESCEEYTDINESEN